MNRTHCAMFYSVLALLGTKRLGTSKQSGAISLFGREYVKTGVFPREFSKALHLTFDRRQGHNYGEMIELDEATAEQSIANVRMFVDGAISTCANTTIWPDTMITTQGCFG